MMSPSKRVKSTPNERTCFKTDMFDAITRLYKRKLLELDTLKTQHSARITAYQCIINEQQKKINRFHHQLALCLFTLMIVGSRLKKIEALHNKIQQILPKRQH